MRYFLQETVEQKWKAADKFDDMLKPKSTRSKKQSVSKKQPVKV
jgi:hypothetical protein